MLDTLTMDLLFTIAASFSLVAMWVASAAILPWTEAELDEVDADANRLIEGLRPVVSARPRLAGTQRR
ncbi:MAG: hypothetical protein GY913_27960 [Proteobacteria bacterium]|nr:hypothetical protein [Pseudomonadota bacterium]MCP4920746.1 hypothetical protein [Pseudomonadota bacterium]